MAHGISVGFNVTIASGTSTSSEIDFGRGFSKVHIDPTGAGGQISFQGAPSVGGVAGTYRTISYAPTSGTSSTQAVTVASAMSGNFVEIPALAGFRFVKVVATGTVANGATLKFSVSDV